MHKNSSVFHWGNSSLEMLPTRALLLPQTNELLICDIHLGKGEYFQQNGIPLTNNSDEQNLLRIKNIVEEHIPNKLIILGDLFHSKYSISESLKIKVELLAATLNIKIELIVGNHDLGCKVKNISFLDFKISNNLILSHEPIGNFEDNFSKLLPIFYEMQSSFLSGIYKRYGDLEGGQIVIYFARDLHLRLMRKREEDLNFDLSLEKFWFNHQNTTQDKHKIIAVSKYTGLPKETTRRKILLLTKDKHLKKSSRNKIFWEFYLTCMEVL